MMQKPNELFKILSSNTSRENNSWKHKDLYRQLYNPELYYVAYQNIYANNGSITKGTNEDIIDGMSINRINEIIETLKDESYQPNPVKRQYIPKKNSDKLRPLGIPSFTDKLIQECMRMILEAIYEPIFSDDSHGFRPSRSCHTALISVKRKGNGVTWWIEGDIKGFFDNINHGTLMTVLEKKIGDIRFLRLIRKFLNAGYVEDWTYHNTYSGTPQGGIISPILANIYLNEFDKWMSNKIDTFNKGIARGINPISKKFNQLTGNQQDKIKRRELWLLDDSLKDDTKNQYLKEIENAKQQITQLRKTARQIGANALNPMDSSFKRMVYTRYADDWIIGINGSKEDAINVKDEVYAYLEQELKLELSFENTRITHGDDGFKFLGYYIRKHQGDYYKQTADGSKKRTMSSKYQLLMPDRREFEFITNNGFGKIVKGEWKPTALKKLFANDDLEIISYYNSCFRGIYNYYAIADNVCNLQTARWLWKLSWGKTMANKYRTTKAKMFDKYSIGGRIGVRYNVKSGEMKTRYLFDEPLTKKKSLPTNNVDYIENLAKFTGRTSLIDRLSAKECEMCGKIDVPLQMHHVKRIKELKTRKHLTQAEILMVSRNRKQIALCDTCHQMAHANDRRK